MKNYLYAFAVLVGIYFLSWFALYKLGVNSLPIQSEDTLPAMFLPAVIVEEKTLYLDSVYETLLEKYPHPDDRGRMLGLTPFYLKKIVHTPELLQNLDSFFIKKFADTDIHYVSAFPIVTPLISLPLHLLAHIFGVSFEWGSLIVLSHLSASVIVAVSGLFLYSILHKHIGLNRRDSLILSIVYLFGTVNLSLLSQAMWQHGTVALLSVVGLWLLYEFFQKRSFTLIFAAGFVIGFLVLARPTALVIAAFLSLLIILETDKSKLPKTLFMYLSGFVPSMLFFWWYNQTFYLSIKNQGYFSQLSNSWLGNFPESFFGLWLSPSKGVFVYSPVLLMIILGLFVVYKNKKFMRRMHFVVFALIVLVYSLVMSKWKHWYGGYSFGYRMLSDVTPFMVLLLVPYIKSAFFEKTKKAFYILLIVSILIHASGLIFFDGIWHAAYDKGFEDTSWLWSIKDSEFAFNARRVFVKFGLLERACDQCMPLSQN